MMRILVIEDSPDFAAFLTAVLALEGYQVQSVALLRAGFDLLQREAIDLVLLDLSLPDGSGLLFFDWPAVRRPRVIVMTSMTEDAVYDSLQAMAVPYFIKPITAAALVQLVRRVLSED